MTKLASPEKPVPVQDDRILLQTRLVLIVVVPFLLLAFLILYFFPVLSGEHFAWEIRPSHDCAFYRIGIPEWGVYVPLHDLWETLASHQGRLSPGDDLHGGHAAGYVTALGPF
jgi:hypothetical protein